MNLVCGKSENGRHNFANPEFPCIWGCGTMSSDLRVEKKKEEYKSPTERKKLRQNTYEQEVAIKIVKEIGDAKLKVGTIMGFIKYKDFSRIEWAWGIINEIKDKLDNPAAYFTELVKTGKVKPYKAREIKKQDKERGNLN